MTSVAGSSDAVTSAAVTQKLPTQRLHPPKQHELFYDYTEDEDDEQYDPETVGIIVLLATFCVIGLIGNALVLSVFGRRKDRLVSTLFIVTLACIDFATCLVIIPYTIYVEYVEHFVHSDVVCKVYQFLITANIPFSAMIMVAIAVDRYFAICWPLVQVITVPRAKAIVSLLALIAVVLGVISACTFGVCVNDEPAPPSRIPNSFINSFAYSTGPASRKDSSELPVERALTTSRVPASSSGFSPEKSNGSQPHWAKAFNESSMLIREFARRRETQVPQQFNRCAVPDATNPLSSGGSNRSDDQPPYPQSWTDEEGLCKSNSVLLSKNFQFYYRKVHTSLYVVFLVAILLLYIAIYRSVIIRSRARRPRDGGRGKNAECRRDVTPEGLQRRNDQKSCTALTTAVNHGATGKTSPGKNGDEIELRYVRNCGTLAGAVKKDGMQQLKSVDGECENTAVEGEGNGGVNLTTRTSWLDSASAANLRIAVMLFVVAVVFVLSFLPALLITQRLVPAHMTIFYLYFANNVANPVIYSFMNKNFRDSLYALVCGNNGRIVTTRSSCHSPLVRS